MVRDGIDSIPDGMYLFTRGNGTLNAVQADIREEARVQAWEFSLTTASKASNTTALDKRQVPDAHCLWVHSILDLQRTDWGISNLRDYLNRAGARFTLTSFASTSKIMGFIVKWVLTNYCVNQPSASGTLQEYDIDFATPNMDRRCGVYRSSLYPCWGSPEIFGKSWSSIPIYCGP
jgi:hypothetical protein